MQLRIVLKWQRTHYMLRFRVPRQCDDYVLLLRYALETLRFHVTT